jgi:hypothetical protein
LRKKSDIHLSNAADKSFAAEMTLPRLAAHLQRQEMSIDKVLNGISSD